MNFIPDTIIRAVCWTLLHSLWQGLILAIVAGGILVLSKKAGSALRYNILCSLLFLFVLVSGYTFYHQLTTPAAGPFPERTTQAGAGLVATGSDHAQSGGTATTYFQATGLFVQNGIDSLVQYFNAHASLVVVIWFMIFLARFVKVMAGLVHVQRIRHYKTNPVSPEWQQRLQQLVVRLQIRHTVTLLESAIIKVPVVIGALRPVILVPIGLLTRLSAEQIESILIHELAHIRRRDYLFNLVQHLVDTLFFFNPALRWVSSLIRSERENCCDDIAIRETQSRRRFVEALVSFHEYSRATRGYALSFAEKDNQVVRRVRRIVERTNHSLNAGERVLLMGALMMLSAAFITIGGSQPNQPNQPNARPTDIRPHATTDRPREIVLSQQPAQTLAHPPVHSITHTRVANVTPSVAPPMNTTSIQPATADTIPPSLPHKREGEASLAELREGLQSLGYTDVDEDKLIRCRDHGVHAWFISKLTAMGYKDITLDRAIELKDHGVNAEFINSFIRIGYTTISLDKAIDLKDHGVSADFIESIKNQGYSELSLLRAQDLRDHGVTAEFIAEIRQLGFQDLTLGKAQQLKDHGVTVAFIQAFKKKMGTQLDLDDYIRLKDSGITPS